MLLGAGHQRYALPSGVDSIHNYYEHMVLEQVAKVSDRARQDADYNSDIACVALNRLPPRYIRHNVDMTFFMSDQELGEMRDKVAAAVNEAINYVDSRDKTTLEDAAQSEA